MSRDPPSNAHRSGGKASPGTHSPSRSNPASSASSPDPTPPDSIRLFSPKNDPASSGNAARGPVTVLLVEDNRVNRAVAGALLRRLGYLCDAAASGEEAVEMATQHAYDLVFMDVQMPGMDGFEATRRIHDAMGPRSPYIVAMTAGGRPGDRERCMAAGMDDYLSKPTRLKALANVLEPEP